MADASRSELPRRAAMGVVGTWRQLNFEQRVAGIGALLLVVSTFGPFSFVEAAIVVTGLSVLLLLRKRAEGREFHIPFGDGSVIAAAGAWSGLLIAVRLFDRPLGQNLLALVCASLLLIAGVAERRKRPPDDLPGPNPEAAQRGPEAVEWEEPSERLPRRRASRAATRDEADTAPLGEPRPRAREADTSPLGQPRAGSGEADTAPLGEPRPGVGASDAPTRAQRRRRRGRTPETPPPPPPEPGQLELTPEPAPNEPLPPPEFHLPDGD